MRGHPSRETLPVGEGSGSKRRAAGALGLCGRSLRNGARGSANHVKYEDRLRGRLAVATGRVLVGESSRQPSRPQFRHAVAALTSCTSARAPRSPGARSHTGHPSGPGLMHPCAFCSLGRRAAGPTPSAQWLAGAGIATRCRAPCIRICSTPVPASAAPESCEQRAVTRLLRTQSRPSCGGARLGEVGQVDRVRDHVGDIVQRGARFRIPEEILPGC